MSDTHNSKFLSRELVRMHRDLGAAILTLTGSNPLPLPSTHTLIEGPVLKTVVGRNLLERRDIRTLLWHARKRRRFTSPTTCICSDYNEESDLTTVSLAFLVPTPVAARWTHLYGKDPQEAQ